MREAIQKIAVGPDRGRDIDRADAESVMRAILAGEIEEVQTAVFLIALRMKRESLGEFLGLFDAMQDSVQTVQASVEELYCLADPFDGYVRTITMTPFIAPVLAACGLPALMHGVETVGPKHGVTAHKVYRLAGISTDIEPKQAAENIASVGWAYLDQSRYAVQLHALSNLRDRIVKRSAITTLERVLVPMRAKQTTHLVLGYVHRAYPEIYANVAKAAGYGSVLLLKGVEGGLAPALNKPLRQFFFAGDLPDEIGAQKSLLETEALFEAQTAALSVGGGTACAQNCLETGLRVLDGDAVSDSDRVARDSLCLAVSHILVAHGKSKTLAEAVVKVRNCLDNGSAKERFNALVLLP